MALRCEKALVPYSCQETVVEQCVYCGKHFCIKHGHQDKACCKSAGCVGRYKHDQTIGERQRWEDERYSIALERNDRSFCGQPQCDHNFYAACGHCEQLYCAEHLKRHTFTFKTYTRRGVTKVNGEITLCEVCEPYLKEYRKDRYE